MQTNIGTETTEDISRSIIEISEGMKKLRAGKLKDKALFILIQHATPSKMKITIKQIKTVFDTIEKLKQEYVK